MSDPPISTEANFGARIRYSDNVSGPLPTSTVVLPNCVHRPAHQVDIGMPRDATDRPLPVSQCRREKIPEQPCSSRIRHEDEKNASAISRSEFCKRRGRGSHGKISIDLALRLVKGSTGVHHTCCARLLVVRCGAYRVKRGDGVIAGGC